MDSDMVRDPHLILFAPQFHSHTAPASSSFSCPHSAIANVHPDSSCKLRRVFMLSSSPFPVSVYSPPPLPSTALPPSNSTIYRCIHGSSLTKSTQTPSAALCPTQTLLTQTLASATVRRHRSCIVQCQPSRGALLNLRAVSPPVLHLTVIQWDSFV